MPEPTFFDDVGCFALIKISWILGARGSLRLFLHGLRDIVSIHSSKLFGHIYFYPNYKCPN